MNGIVLRKFAIRFLALGHNVTVAGPFSELISSTDNGFLLFTVVCLLYKGCSGVSRIIAGKQVPALAGNPCVIHPVSEHYTVKCFST